MTAQGSTRQVFKPLPTVRRLVAKIPGAVWLKRRLFGASPPVGGVSYRRPMDRGAPPPCSQRASLGDQGENRIEREADTFVLYRIIGNDLPPRHAIGQSRKNLAFILEHEPDLPACEKRFVVNRIVDPNEEAAILRLLTDAGVGYIHLPFSRETYRQAEWDIEGVPVEYAPWTARFAELNEAEKGQVLMRLYRHKNNAVMNNNGARNAALREGRRIAKWVLPWDGNCFVTRVAWDEIVRSIEENPGLRYFVVPMARVTDNARLLDSDFRPEASEEPQLIFRRDSPLEFDPDYYYGRRPKVELLWRLGVPGQWDTWPLQPWDPECPAYVDEAGAFAYAGWVARLSSGRAHLEEDEERTVDNGGAFRDRGFARVEAIKTLIDRLDDEVAKPHHARPLLVAIPEARAGLPLPESASGNGADTLLGRLREAADQALSRGPFSVVHKKSLPPSRNPHDYWHPAPYYWPHPLRLPGLPYVRRDGRRVPGTQLYEPLSDKYDRTRLQRLFDDTFVLTLAWRLLGGDRYAQHAAELVRTWFLVPDTRMTPHLKYAQVRKGHNGNQGNHTGIIEMKDLYYFLDAVRLLRSDGWLSQSEQIGFEEWLGQYLNWLWTSPQGRQERAAANNHGTYYDLQIAAVTAFLGETRRLRETLRDSRSRLLCQVDPAGAQGAEMRRTNTAHYCCFNLQGWIHLAQLAEACGEDLWSFQSTDGRGIRRAMQWVLSHMGKKWPYRQIEPFDYERFYPIYHTYVRRYGEPAKLRINSIPEPEEIKPLFFPHDGIMPFWQLASFMRDAVGGTARDAQARQRSSNGALVLQYRRVRKHRASGHGGG